MRGGAWPITLLGTFLLITGVGNRIWTGSNVQSATFAFAALVSFGTAAALFAASRGEALRRGEPRPEPAPRAVPAGSFGAATAGFATAALIFGFVFGLWLIIFGLGLLLAAGFLLVRELAAQRRAERALAGPTEGAEPR